MNHLKNMFIKHPHSVGETYFQHFRYAAKTSFRVAKISLIIMIHAIFPFTYETKAGEMLKELSDELQSRKKGEQSE